MCYCAILPLYIWMCNYAIPPFYLGVKTYPYKKSIANVWLISISKMAPELMKTHDPYISKTFRGFSLRSIYVSCRRAMRLLHWNVWYNDKEKATIYCIKEINWLLCKTRLMTEGVTWVIPDNSWVRFTVLTDNGIRQLESWRRRYIFVFF